MRRYVEKCKRPKKSGPDGEVILAAEFRMEMGYDCMSL